MSTAVDCDTAFPHVTLHGFFGVAASIIICPDGIDFGNEDNQPTRFIVLFVTLRGFTTIIWQPWPSWLNE